MKSKKLLFYLLLHREEKINQDILIDALWHSASYKSGGDSLRKALQHTRQILKSTVAGKGDFILSGRGFCQISSNVSVWLDTEEFQNLVKRVKMLNEQHGIYEDYLKKALSIYKDGFAIGWYDSWVEEMRRHYQGLYEECLTMMAELSFSKNKFKEAINWYKKLIKINFYNEEYHRKLMLAYSKVKRYREIIKDFERLKKMLKEELDTEPQQVTTALYKSLIC
jgi:DNA-binding SARP family transcriptional activator